VKSVFAAGKLLVGNYEKLHVADIRGETITLRPFEAFVVHMGEKDISA
jgi:hypothetical protein